MSSTDKGERKKRKSEDHHKGSNMMDKCQKRMRIGRRECAVHIVGMKRDAATTRHHSAVEFHAKKSHTLMTRACHAQLDMIALHNPSHMYHVLQVLHSIGKPEHSAVSPPLNKCSSATGAIDGSAGSQTVLGGLDGAAGEDVLGNSKLVDGFFIASLDCETIVNILCTLDSVKFNDVLSIYTSRWHVDSVHGELLHLLEFLTGIPTNLPISVDLRSLPALKKFCLSAYQRRAGRTTNLKLPVAWTSDGLYDMKFNIDSLEVVDRFGVHTCASSFYVDEGSLPHGFVQSDIMIINNWSEHCAALQSIDDGPWICNYQLQCLAPCCTCTRPLGDGFSLRDFAPVGYRHGAWTNSPTRTMKCSADSSAVGVVGSG
jgi:hypothetical protein